MDQSDDDEPDQALIELVWFMEDCDEAEEVFGDELFQCPVCNSYADINGFIKHEKKIN